MQLLDFGRYKEHLGATVFHNYDTTIFWIHNEILRCNCMIWEMLQSHIKGVKVRS
jgi:hypothetical protein